MHQEDYCIVMKHYLETKNCQVFTVHTIADGFDMLDKNKPDILFLDNNLPDGEGWDHLQTIFLNYPLTKINLVSAYKSMKDISYTDPNIRVWEKPISLQQLNDILNLQN